jgi:hypothetical protein
MKGNGSAGEEGSGAGDIKLPISTSWHFAHKYINIRNPWKTKIQMFARRKLNYEI